ncbi:MAG: hypothetical protein KatS3mg081_2376 [Gemmatimonadales bacterium]|nr:MAG: hypothetical protein KatS3mg081_2376 [Gemmatimonadales bacterium]
MEQLLKCTVEPGVFSSEWAVRLQSEGGPVSFFVDRSLVEAPQTPERGQPVEGHVRVTVLEHKPNLALIRLPAQSSSGTSSVWVPSSLLVANGR